MSNLVTPLRALQSAAYSMDNLTITDRFIFIRAYETGCVVETDPTSSWYDFVCNCLLLLQSKSRNELDELTMYRTLEVLATRVSAWRFLEDVTSHLSYLRGEPLTITPGPLPLTAQQAMPYYNTTLTPFHESSN
jgi:hypothetical protein